MWHCAATPMRGSFSRQPDRAFFNENAWSYKQVHGQETFVTAGIGCYGPPMRVGTNSEITVINMIFSKESAS